MIDYKNKAKNFCNLIVEGKYDEAYDLLDPSVTSELTKGEMIETYEDMIEYFTEEGPCEISVVEPPIITDLEEGLKLVYVPIQSNNEFGESEAISLTFDTAGTICDIEFGRP